MALTYNEFIKAVGKPTTFYKFLNDEKNHHGFQYKMGENVDTLEFNPSGSCDPGGLYFTDEKRIISFLDFGPHLACITLLPDAKFYIDPHGNKYKTNKFQIDFIFENFIDVAKLNTYAIPRSITDIRLIDYWLSVLDKTLSDDTIKYFQKIQSIHPEVKHALLTCPPLVNKTQPPVVAVAPVVANLPLHTFNLCRLAVLKDPQNIHLIKDEAIKQQIRNKYYVTPKI